MTTAAYGRLALIVPRYGKLLLATDLSPASAAATEQAFELAQRLGSPLLIVSVIDPGQLRLPGGRFGQRVDQVRAQRELVAQDLVERGRRIGLTVSFLIWEGDPGRGTVGRFLIGSVSDYVVRHATCPVLVVRRTTDDAPPITPVPPH
jgi:nucleotide-binding universal stress UspA family protein